jgi:hypothetical protein
VIGKVLRGRSVTGLLYYLFGPGQREEHTDPHLVAGWRHPAELEPPLRPDGHRDFRRLNGLLSQPHAALGPRGFVQPVWHCVVRAAPGDRMLSDVEWGRLARDIMHRTGLAPHGQDDDAVRWVAVRHAPDHIHVVAMLARQDRTHPRHWNDFYRVREACQAAEERHGLRRTAPADRTAGRRPTRAEQEKARRHGRSESRSAGPSALLQPEWPARRNSSPGCRTLVCWCGSGTAAVIWVRSPAMPWRSHLTRHGPEDRSGSVAGSWPPT